MKREEYDSLVSVAIYEDGKCGQNPIETYLYLLKILSTWQISIWYRRHPVLKRLSSLKYQSAIEMICRRVNLDTIPLRSNGAVCHLRIPSLLFAQRRQPNGVHSYVLYFRSSQVFLLICCLKFISFISFRKIQHPNSSNDA